MNKVEQKKIETLTKSIGVKFSNIDLLKTALTHRSYINESGEDHIEQNERLEFLGDAVLELMVTEHLFKTYPDHEEGLLTSFRAAVVRTESLAEEAERLNFGGYIYMSKGEESTGGRERPYILANTFEAVIGAIYIDQGFESAKKFIEENVCYKLSTVIKNRLDIDPKSKFQEIAQDKTKITPQYSFISAKGPDHNKIFEMALMLGDIEISRGKGKSKQEAEQKAAQEALDKWKSISKNLNNKL